MKVLLVTMYFPPAGGGGVQRSLKLAQYLPALGIETHVLAPDDPKWVHRDPELRVPTQAWIHRARYIGPRARKPAEELRAADGLERMLVQAQVTARRLLLPDASVTWNLTAIPAAIRIARREGIDAVITTSPPGPSTSSAPPSRARAALGGSPTFAIRWSRTSTAVTTPPRRVRARRRTSRSRASSHAVPTRSRASPRRSRTRCAASTRADRFA